VKEIIRPVITPGIICGKTTLKKVYTSLKQRGYDPISQLSGYLISNDLGYISNYKNARNELSKLDRNIIIELLLKEYLK